MPLEASNSRCPDVLLARARIEAAQGEVNEAQTAFSQYIQLKPDDSRGYAYFARFLIDQEQYQQADELSAIAMQKNAEDPAALAVRGQILDMKGQSQQGLELLEKSCRINPENADAQFQAGAIDDRAKLHAEAVKHFEKVVALDPANPSGWDYLALNLEPLGKIEAAETAYRKGLAANQEAQDEPDFDAFLDYNYGVFLEKRNQLADSMAHLNRAVKLVPQVRDTWYERAKVNLQMHHYRAARRDAEKADSLPERTGGVINLQVYALLEQIYRRLGETALADKYAGLSRATPPPVRKEYGMQTPQ
jgi:tetratricopeptide (TPR) repeat protein